MNKNCPCPSFPPVCGYVRKFRSGHEMRQLSARQPFQGFPSKRGLLWNSCCVRPRRLNNNNSRKRLSARSLLTTKGEKKWLENERRAEGGEGENARGLLPFCAFCTVIAVKWMLSEAQVLSPSYVLFSDSVFPLFPRLSLRMCRAVCQ